MRLLVVTAVDAERDAALAGLEPAPDLAWSAGLSRPTRTGRRGGTDVVAMAAGIGPVAAGVVTAGALAAVAGTVDVVINVGIAGGFAGRADLGDLVVADRVVFADLGALTDGGFLDVRGLGLDHDTALACPVADRVAAALAAAGLPYRRGSVLTLATMTGTGPRAAELAAAHPGAAAEAMEGYGVAAAAVEHGVPWVELRAVSNLVGPRDRSTWDVPGALGRLGAAVAALADHLPAAPR